MLASNASLPRRRTVCLQRAYCLDVFTVCRLTMYSPEVVPSSHRKSVRKPRKCRRKLNIPVNESKGESSILEEDQEDTELNETGMDFSPDVSEYVPTETESSDDETLLQKQKPQKKKRLAREVLGPSNTLNSICSTPTSSRLASCVPSPLFDLSEMSSFTMPSINISDLFDNVENIDPQINQDADTPLSPKKDCRSHPITANKGQVKCNKKIETMTEKQFKIVHNINEKNINEEQDCRFYLITANKGLVKCNKKIETITEKQIEIVHDINENDIHEEKPKQINVLTFSEDQENAQVETSQKSTIAKLSHLAWLEIKHIMEHRSSSGSQNSKCDDVENRKSKKRQASEVENEEVREPQTNKENENVIELIVTEMCHENVQAATENNEKASAVINNKDCQEHAQAVTESRGKELLAPIAIEECEYNAQIVAENNDEQVLAPIVIEGGQENAQENATPQRGRKRKRDEKNWNDNLNKRMKNSGQSYSGTRNKKKRDEKILKSPCSCKRECFNKIDNMKRENIFKRFWEIGNHERQWEFILRFISAQSIKKMTLERKCNRSQTIIYKLPLSEENNTVRSVVVCKQMFLNTLGITEKWVYTALDKNEAQIEDLRGKHLNRPRRMSPLTEESIVAHIKLFPVVESHYTRKNSTKLYLNETLNLSKMYRLYKTWFSEQPEYEPSSLASKSQYESIFNSKFNYSFFKPKKDLCDTCFIYNNADAERKIQLKEKYEAHIAEKQAVRRLKNDEKENPFNEIKTVACFDLEKVLYIPQSEVSSFYYKRKYAVYNFTIYDLLNKKGYCYVWHQTIAKRGAIEISSCLWHFINEEFENGKRQISFYSDSCAGQNKNRFVFAMYQYASKMLGIDICHRFFEKGHSQSEGDTMHACVERAKKNQIVYTPEQMYYIISTSKVEGNKFTVKEMTQSDFLNFKDLVTKPSSNSNWLTDDDDQKVFWSRLKEIQVKHSNPEKFLFRYSLETNEEKSLSTNKTHSRRRRKATTQNEPFSLCTAYQEPIPIPTLLHKDLMDLCNTGAIPSHYHGFYKSLKTIDAVIPESDDSENEL